VAAVQAFQPTSAKHIQTVLRQAMNAPKQFSITEPEMNVVEL
jgi:hypothetical protein